MKLLYTGKTKDVFKLKNNTCILKFKDDVTGENGVFDPGANKVGLSIDGIGKSGLRLSTYFFEILKENKIPTHFINSNIDDCTMTVHKAIFFGEGVEVIVRYRAVGSFIKRYGKYSKEGDKLNSYIEFTLKDDKRNDPLITKEGLIELNLMTKQEYKKIVKLTKKIASIIKNELLKKEIELYDIKLEFGKIGNKHKKIALIDELSGGNMRAYKNGIYIEPLKLEAIMQGQ